MRADSQALWGSLDGAFLRSAATKSRGIARSIIINAPFAWDDASSRWGISRDHDDTDT
jgi:hypothetical protein